MIQTHNAKARAMLLDCTLPPSMWAEAISTANYLHARSPTSSNNGMTPYEKLFGRNPEVGHLRRFGCKAFKTLPTTHRSKFGTRADALFMLGYVHDSTTIWRFWDPHRRQVIQASNVTFTESGASAVGLGLGASSGLELNSSSELELNSSGGLGLDASSGSLANLEGNTGRYDLRKRPRAVAHRIRVEEEPMDSADPVSYRGSHCAPEVWSEMV